MEGIKIDKRGKRPKIIFEEEEDNDNDVLNSKTIREKCARMQNMRQKTNSNIKQNLNTTNSTLFGNNNNNNNNNDNVFHKDNEMFNESLNDEIKRKAEPSLLSDDDFMKKHLEANSETIY